MPRFLPSLLALLVLAGCQPNQSPGGSPDEFTKEDSSALLKVLDQQVAAWNAGDIQGYMAGYTREGGLRIASDRGISRGWEQIHELYSTNYSSPEIMGALSFHDLEVTPLSATHAEVFGRYLLKRKAPLPDSSGYYTMLFHKTPTGWRILHDHSTERRPEAK